MSEPKIQITITAIPNGYNPDSSQHKISVFITPRILEPGTIRDFPLIAEWYKWHPLLFRVPGIVKLRFGKQSGNSITGNPFEARIRWDKGRVGAENNDSQIGRKVWMACFPSDTPVVPWVSEQKLVNPDAVHSLFAGGRKNLEAELSRRNVPNVSSLSFRELVEKAYQILDPSEFLSASAPEKLIQPVSAPLRVAEKTNNEKFIDAISEAAAEFHDSFSGLSQFPDILRLAGWVYDYDLEAGEQINTISLQQYNLVKLEIDLNHPLVAANPALEGLARKVAFLSPWTACTFQSNRVSLRYKTDAVYFSIKDGIIEPARPGVYTIAAQQEDHKEILQQAIAAADATAQSPGEGKFRIGDFKGRVSRGLGIYVDKIDTILSHQLRNALLPDASTTELTENLILYGHQLDTGFRIDVQLEDNSRKASLCRRVASLYKGQTENFPILQKLKDEGWVAESLQFEGGELKVDEEITRWDNWSLVCPHIGSYTGEEDNENSQETNPFYKNVKLKILPEKLLPMRFGSSYRFRIRVTDLCGNSAAFEQESDGLWTEPVTYLRMENVNAPDIFLGEPIIINGGVSNNHYGESLQKVVIRSFFRNGEMICNQTATRYLAAPKVQLRIAELHGKLDLDMQGSDSNRLYELLENSEVDGDDRELIVSGPGRINYFTDPLVTGIEVKTDYFVFDTSEVSVPEAGNYSERKFHRLKLESGRNAAVHAPDSNLAIQLEPGYSTELEIRSKVHSPDVLFPGHNVKNDGYWNNYTSGDAVVRAELIHAVQKPMLIQKTYPSTVERFLNQIAFQSFDKVIARLPNDDRTSFSEVFAESFPMFTTGEMHLAASVRELVQNHQFDTGYEIKESTVSLLQQINIPELLAKEKFDYYRLYERFNVNPSKISAGETESNARMALQLKQAFTHSFGDTKFRRVLYRFEAESKFKEFFPPAIKDFSVTADAPHYTKILNSGIPPVPVIDRIEPVLTWDIQPQTVTRKHHSFRIYFKGDWYLTGEREKIAVLYINDNRPLTVPDSMVGLVSELGKDPIHQTPATAGLEDFFVTPDQLQQAGFDYEPYLIRDIQPWLLHSEKTLPDTNASAAVNSLAAAVFDVQFDKETKRYYADIQINSMHTVYLKNYFPFIQFAIARYQQYSIRQKDQYDYRFSPVVMTDRCQILPSRKLTWKKDFSEIVLEGDVNRAPAMDADILPNYVYCTVESKVSNGLNMVVDNKNYRYHTYYYIMSPRDNNTRFVFSKESPQLISGHNLLDPFNNADRLIIEEYEEYSPQRDGSIPSVEEISYVDLKNDMRMRLVFFYIIEK